MSSIMTKFRLTMKLLVKERLILAVKETLIKIIQNSKSVSHSYTVNLLISKADKLVIKFIFYFKKRMESLTRGC